MDYGDDRSNLTCVKFVKFCVPRVYLPFKFSSARLLARVLTNDSIDNEPTIDDNPANLKVNITVLSTFRGKENGKILRISYYLSYTF